MQYHGNYVHTLGRIHNISIMSRIDSFYTAYHMGIQNVAHILPGFQGPKRCIQYLASHPHKSIFYPSNYYDDSNIFRLTWSGNQV